MSSGSFSCSNFGRACILQYLKKKCKCQKFADVRISTTDRNPHKLFFACRENVCGFVDWAHPINCPCLDIESAHNEADADEVSNIPTIVKALEARMLAVEGDLKHTSVVVDEIKHIAISSRLMFISMMLMVFLTFFVVLVK
jgi:hypothetical protein